MDEKDEKLVINKVGTNLNVDKNQRNCRCISSRIQVKYFEYLVWGQSLCGK